MKYFLIALTVCLYGKSAPAQSPADSVKAVISKLFTGMKTADTSLMKSCFSDEAILQTVVSRPGNPVKLETEPLGDFMLSVSKITPGDADEQIRFESVSTDGDLAIAWTPYNFYYKGKFSHCGVDSWQLVRLKGEWKIVYLIDTRRKAGCGE